MAFADDLDKMLDDCADQLGVTIDVTHRTRGAIDTATGVRTATTVTDAGITAERFAASAERVGTVTVESVRYRVRASELSFTPAEGDLVTDGGVVRSVVLVDTAIDRKDFVLHCSDQIGGR